MSTGKLTETTFVSGPDDKLNVIDVYTEKADSILNSYQDKFHSVSDSLDDFLSGMSDLNIGGKLDFLNQGLNSINQGLNQGLNIFNQLANGNLGALAQLNSGLLGGKFPFLNSQAMRSIAGIAGLLGGKSNLSLSTMTNILANAGILKNGPNALREFNNVVNKANNLIRTAGRISDRLSGGLNNGNRSTYKNKPIAFEEVLSKSIVNYGTLNPLSNNISSSINNDLDVLVGGDKSAITSILRPSVDRVSTLSKKTDYDRKKTTLTVDKLLNNIEGTELSVAIKTLSPEAQEVLVRGVAEDTVFENNVVALDGDVNVINSQVSIQNKEAISEILNLVTEGKQEISTRNSGLDCTVLSGIVHLASKAGFPKPFECIAKNKPVELMLEVSKPLLIRAVEEADIELIMDIGNTAVAKEIPKIIPNIVYEIKSNINRPHKLSQQEFASYYKEVKGLMKRVNETWTKCKVGKLELVDASGVAENPFFADLLEAQLNELKSVDYNLNNLQIAYPMSGIQDTTKILNEIALPEPTISYDVDGNEVIENPTPYKRKEVLKIEKEDYEDEPFILLGKVFLNNDVDSELKKHFPYFYETLEFKPMPIV